MSRESHSLLSELRGLADAGRRRRFFRGLTLPLSAVKFLFGHPSLWLWAVLPALLNLLIFAVVAIGLLLNVGTLLEWIWAQPDLEIWYHWILRGLWYLVFAVFMVGSVIVSYYLVLLVGGTVASPFNDRLSEETERALKGDVDDARAGESMAVGIARSAAISLARLLMYLAGLAVLLPLHLVPGFGNLVFAASAACLSAGFLSIEYTDDTLDRRGLSFADKLRTVRHNGALSAGFGAGTSLLLVIPIINLLAMPVAVVAGTVLGLAMDVEE